MLIDRIGNARQLLRNGQLVNESSVSTSIVFPILQALGWDVFNPTVVAPEYRVENRRVDFALLHHGKPVVFVEVKQPGRGVGADRQLFEYAFHEGVPLAVLTDGATWHLYLPAMQGSYDERRVYLLDLVEREPAESAERLNRYLNFEAVANGDALERAQQDYKRSRQRREAREAIPSTWQAMVEEGDHRLIEALVSEVESRSGYRPELEDVFGFLAGLKLSQAPAPRPLPRPPIQPVVPSSVVPPSFPLNGAVPRIGFVLDGAFTPARNGRDTLIKVFQALADRDPSFLDRFVALPKHGRTRRYLARSPEALYPNDPSFVSASTVAEVRSGYWLMTNASHHKMAEIAKQATAVAGLTYGRDLSVRMK